MENSRILNWQRWSTTRKTQVVVTAFGILLTAVFVVGDVLQLGLPRNWPGNLIWALGMQLLRPSDVVARCFGMYEKLGFWGWRALELSTNAVLAFAFGTALGMSIAIVKRIWNQRNL